MVDNNEDGAQHRRDLRGESLGDVAPGELPRNQFDQAILVTDNQDEVSSLVTHLSRDSLPADESPIEPGNRLIDSAPQSPQISTMNSTPSEEVRYITEEDSMPPTLREAHPFLRSANPVVASAAASNLNPSLRDLHAVLADTSQTETETIMAEQDARVRLHDATMEMQQAAERLDVTRRVSQNTQRRIQQYENANRVIGNREQVESQGDDFESPVTAAFDRFRRRRTAQRAAAGTSAMSSTTQAARSHSHPSRRDESRTDQSSPSISPFDMAIAAYLGPLDPRNCELDPRISELYPSALDFRHRMMMQSRNVQDHTMIEGGGAPGARENLHPSNNSTSHSRHAGVQTSLTRNPPVFANLTNAVERSSSRAPGHHSSSDDRSLLGRRQPLESGSGFLGRPSNSHWRTQSPLEEWERDLMGLPAADASSRRPPDASSSRPMGVEETNRRLIESNAWNPQSSDPVPSVDFANANPFGSSGSDNRRSNPLMTGGRARYPTARSRTNMLRGTTRQDVISMKPPPKTKAEMTVDMECRICMEQPATVACLPCGKLKDSRFLGVASLTICRSLRNVQMVLRCLRAESAKQLGKASQKKRSRGTTPLSIMSRSHLDEGMIQC